MTSPFTRRFQVRHYELDAARRVNRAVYLRWIEEAYNDALNAAGHPQQCTRVDGWRSFPSGHEVQYFAPALEGDRVEVVSWLSEIHPDNWAWVHEVFNARSHRLLARAYSPAALVSPKLGPATLRQLVEAILRGPKN